ncbi:DMT family transporter [Verminephrobacter aporrectodeae subsp. tuberculatae]|uniref:DMT family transporter n=1 Tax=Verminephrobacter aporrectodeae TaxID=1110389 RepID=UPI000495ED3E|nr:DMT family transporter [Verminephrobacter aporrectodeae]MCW5219757.1 DMT family transporter [Verminephrobacter aporrectodeae subsp. tuberculatae]MCW5287545.1 DMT family transporter [Verminephrobacter aporrectodeae subsp. tuberculatae]
MTTASLAGRTTDHPYFWPTVFILMWSSGYVAGKVGLPYAGPFTLISMRFASAALILLLVSIITGASWPSRPKDYLHLAAVGLLVQALQFSGLYLGLSLGVAAGTSAVMVGMMPIFTAIGAIVFLGEKVSPRQALGFLVGLLGVALVVAHKMGVSDAQWGGYLAILAALAGITIGTLYQKKFCVGIDLRTGGFVQLTVASLVAVPMALFAEEFRVIWTAEVMGSIAWLSLINSIGAVSVLFMLVQRGQASQVAGLFYLIPSVTAVMGYLVLHETLTPLQAVGFAVSAIGVYLSTRKTP